MASRDRSLARSSSSSLSSSSVVVVVVVVVFVVGLRRSVGRSRRVADEQTRPFVCHPPQPFVCHPPRASASASERYRRVTNDRTRTVPKRRGVSTGASVSGASDDRSDGKDVRRRRTKRQRARVVRAQRASGDASRGATRRTDGETDAATRRFGALGNTVVRDCR